jgi:hypothetical protein
VRLLGTARIARASVHGFDLGASRGAAKATKDLDGSKSFRAHDTNQSRRRPSRRDAEAESQVPERCSKSLPSVVLREEAAAAGGASRSRPEHEAESPAGDVERKRMALDQINPSIPAEEENAKRQKSHYRDREYQKKAVQGRAKATDRDGQGQSRPGSHGAEH